MTVQIPGHRLYWQTVCIECVDTLGITGCTIVDGTPVERVFGTDPRPRGWTGRRSTPEELLGHVASVGYMLPRRPREPARLDVGALLDQLWRNPAA